MAKARAGKGFGGFAAACAVFLALMFAVLAANYFYFKEVPLKTPIVWALEPVAHMLVIIALFMFFARMRLNDMPAFFTGFAKRWPYLLIGAVLVWARYSVGTFEFSKYLTAAGIASLGLFVFGFKRLRSLRRRYERELILAALAYLFLRVVFGLDSVIYSMLMMLFG
ncbi:MAG: hypothetical protein V1676_06440 [Candidatus Diapherotrites archaeon]